MNILNKQICQQGFGLISNSYNRFFLLSILWRPVPFLWQCPGVGWAGAAPSGAAAGSAGHLLVSEVQRRHASSPSIAKGKLLQL